MPKKERVSLDPRAQTPPARDATTAPARPDILRLRMTREHPSDRVTARPVAPDGSVDLDYAKHVLDDALGRGLVRDEGHAAGGAKSVSSALAGGGLPPKVGSFKRTLASLGAGPPPLGAGQLNPEEGSRLRDISDASDRLTPDARTLVTPEARPAASARSAPADRSKHAPEGAMPTHGQLGLHEDVDEDVFDRPTLDAIVDPLTGIERALHPSEIPTAPPPEDFDAHHREMPRPSRLDGLAELREDAVSLPPEPALSARGRSASPPAVERSSPEQEMRDRFAMGDFSGALERAESILKSNPTNTEARSMAAKCADVLFEMYSSRIGNFSRSPRVIMAPDKIRWLSLDHRAGFLLSLIDGQSTVDDVLDVSGMKRLDAMRHLVGLVEQKVIELV